MERYVAVIMCNIKIQLIIPQKWYGVLDTNGYNRGINKVLKRRVFFSPFGDEVEPDFTLPISPTFQRHANAFYQVQFLQVCDSKAECIQYVKSRRVSYPAVYNDRRLLEYIPPPRPIGQRAIAGIPNALPPFEPEIANEIDANPELNAEIQNDLPPNGPESANGHVILAEIDQNPVDAYAPNISAEILSEAINDAAPIASTSASARNVSSVEDLSETNRIKAEIKNEVFERILKANERNPIVDLTTDSDEEDSIENEIAPTASNGFGTNGGNMNQDTTEMIEPTAIAATVASTAAEILHEPNANALPAGSTSATTSTRNVTSIRIDAAPVASTSASARNVSSADDFSDANRVKAEFKTELRDRLLEANKRNPIVDLTDDPEEASAFAAIENDFNFEESDDDMQIVLDSVTSSDFIATQIKFDFDGWDILSGDIPFVLNVS